MRSPSLVSLSVYSYLLHSISTATATFLPTGLLSERQTDISQSSAKALYTRSHSLGDDYTFSPRDGWHIVNATDLDYKYDDYADATLSKREARSKSKKAKAGSKAKAKTSTKSLLTTVGGLITHVLDDVWNALKGLGKAQDVTITWYTGKDLQNPSCWANQAWAPTDKSFTCALTLQGWTNQPKCFNFLEVCNGTKKCIFVRVVDSCAGCAAGSKHVDLTKAAFAGLADVNQGVLTVQMRQATEPNVWFEDLWGPRH